MVILGIVVMCGANDINVSGGGLVLAVCGILVLTCAVTLPPFGSPAPNIDQGVYKVAFVYVAGDNVSVGVEEKSGSVENLRLYQFPKSAFGGSILVNAKKLTVTENGNFKKLELGMRSQSEKVVLNH